MNPIRWMVSFFAALWLLAMFTCQQSHSQTAPAVNLATSFSIHAEVAPLDCGGGCTTPASIIGWTFPLLSNVEIRQSNMIAPSVGFQFYGGGANFFSPWIQKQLNKTLLPKNTLSPYFFAEGGADRISNSGKPTIQHVAGRIGGGLLHYPKGNKKLAIKLGEVSWLDAPGYNRGTVVFGSGLKGIF